MTQRKISIDLKDKSREEWLMMRKKGLGGSDISGLLGISKWASPLSIYLDKIDESPIEQQENEFMDWGNKLEDLLAKEFESITNKKVRRFNRMVIDNDYDFLLANIDRSVVGENAGLEIKTCSEYVKSDWNWDDNRQLFDMPLKYLCQCLHYMDVTNCNVWYIAVLIGGNKFRWGKIERRFYEKEIKMIKEKCIDFWENNVIKKIAPLPIDIDSDLIDKMYPNRNSENTIELPNDYKGVLEDYKNVKQSLRDLTKRRDALKNQISFKLGDNSSAVCNNWKINYSTISSTRIDSKQLKDEYPNVYESVLKQSAYKKLSIKDL
ncbi:MAG: YqaJ viral recombinase family protein [Candidatus Neomarinimicrobiota bacterium]